MDWRKQLRKADGRKLFRHAVFLALGWVALFVLLEGAASTVLWLISLARDTRPAMAEMQHAEYDPEIGWVNRPNVFIKDIYGPGTYLRTNARAFRNDAETEKNVPPGKIRLVCSGDSFTLGYGVSNGQTWCDLLAKRNADVDSVNLGEGGYGVDQAYLWYRRAGSGIDHQVHVFAFITEDINRMLKPVMFGYPKPVLKLQGNDLVVANAPLPRRAYYVPWLTANFQVLQNLRMIKLVLDVHDFVFGSQPPPLTDTSEFAPVLLRIFETLGQLNAAQGSTVVFVHLPQLEDYGQMVAQSLFAGLSAELQQRHLELVDLVGDFQKIPREQLDALFFPTGYPPCPGAGKHYTARGHEVIAQMMEAKLAPILESARRRREGRGLAAKDGM